MTPTERDAARRRIVAWVHGIEGGDVDHPQDPGGLTRAGGLTQAALDTARTARRLPRRDIRDATPEDLALVQAHWWVAIAGDALLDRTSECVVRIVYDAAWNQGLAYAPRLLQWALGVPGDGVLGPKTLATLAETPAIPLAWLLVWGRTQRYLATVRHRRARGLDPWYYFAGWMARLWDLSQPLRPNGGLP